MPKIAIVEDEAIVALDIRRTLQRRGYEVTGVFDSGEVLLENYSSVSPDLILMDVHIRGSLDGIETSAIIRERYGTPVILLTAHAEADTIARATRSEPFAYIIKPFEERELSAAIEIALYKGGMEARLRASEARYKSLFRDGLSANFVADSNGSLTEVNESFKRLISISDPGQLPSLDSMFAEPGVRESFFAVLSVSGRFPQTEIAVRGLDGALHTVLAQAALMPAGSGDPGFIQGEFIDLTERKRLEEGLIQAQKMDAVGRLASGVAHDFNNILTAIIGYTDILAGELPVKGTVAEDLKGIKSTAMKAVAITRQLLAFSRKQPYSPKTFNVNTMIRDSERMLKRLLPAAIDLRMRLYASRASAVADPSQLEQAILNLVVNARDAMPGGGTISIVTRNETLDSQLRLANGTVLDKGDYLAARIGDTGTGVPPGIADSIFDPFFTTKTDGKGTGLGLAIVQTVMKRIGGGVSLVPDRAEGAEFSLWIPLCNSQASLDSENGAADPSVTPKERKSGVGKCILLVDDDQDILDVTSRILGRAGYEVFAAANGGEALLLAEQPRIRIDLLVADIVMPRMEGGALADRLLQNREDMRVLLVSGHPEKTPDEEGSSRFLAKPFSEVQLLDAVEAALATPVPSMRP